MAALTLALACLFWPPGAASLMPVPMAPLHLRCMGALYLGVAISLLACASQRDRAAVRIPMTLVAVGAAAMAMAACTVSPWPRVFTLVHASVAAAATVWVWRSRELGAPMERPDPALLLLAALLAAVALTLALLPRYAAARWPWPMQPGLAPFYAAPMLAWSLAAAQVARERRRAARRLALIALFASGVGLLGASGWHGSLLAGPAGWSWWTAIGSATVLVLQRLLRGVQPAL